MIETLDKQLIQEMVKPTPAVPKMQESKPIRKVDLHLRFEKVCKYLRKKYNKSNSRKH